MHKGGWSIFINESWDRIDVQIKLKVAILNSSNNQTLDLKQLGVTIERQLKKSYEMSYTKKSYQTAVMKNGLDYLTSKSYSKLADKHVTVKVSVQHRIINRENGLFPDELLVQIRNNIGRWIPLYGNAARGGRFLNLNEKYVPDMIKGLDLNTIPHELGHSLGLLHVNAPDTYREDPRQYFPVSRQHTKDSLNAMFGGDIHYMHNLTSTVITPRQMDIIIENYRMNKLNR